VIFRLLGEETSGAKAHVNVIKEIQIKSMDEFLKGRAFFWLTKKIQRERN
jgi:hypothetical protein